MKTNNERKTAWEVLYDFLTEIFAILIPGAYFVSFFVFAILLYVCCVSKDTSTGVTVLSGRISSTFGLLIAAATYCFGAFFHRREIKVVDEASARHIYKKSKHESGHSYAYANALSADYIRRYAYILHYHLYLYAYGITDPSKLSADNATDAEKKEAELVRELNSVIEEEIYNVARNVETDKIQNADKSQNDRVKDLIISFQKKSDAKGEIARNTGDSDTANQPGADGTAEKMRGFSRKDMVEILRERLMAEKKNTYILRRTDARDYKRFLQVLNEESHGALKENLEHSIWKKLKNFKLVDARKNDLGENEKDLFESLCKILEDFFPKGLREYEGSDLPEIGPKKDRRLRISILASNTRTLPVIANRQKRCRNLRRDLEDLLKKRNLSMESLQIEHVVRRIENLIDDDLNSRVEWPYTRMYQYCFDRGLRFADLVDWGDGDAVKDDFVFVIDTLGLTTGASISDEYKRSKIRVNTDKLDIEIQEPSLGRILEKNEAHIRFNNSMWYAKELLWWPLGIAVAVFGGFIILSKVFTDNAYFYSNNMLWIYLLALTVLYICAGLYIDWSVREIMHYQRVRELTMFLEAKYLHNRKQGETEAAARE